MHLNIFCACNNINNVYIEYVRTLMFTCDVDRISQYLACLYTVVVNIAAKGIIQSVHY